MKFYFRVDGMGLIPIFIPFFVSVLVLLIFSNKMFTLKSAIQMVGILYGPLLLIALIAIFTSFCTLNDQGVNIHFFGIFNKTISYSSIESIEETDKGFNFFALSASKLKIRSNKKDYIFSIKEMDLFVSLLKKRTKSA